jgi:hypothetical protein
MDFKFMFEACDSQYVTTSATKNNISFTYRLKKFLLIVVITGGVRQSTGKTNGSL